VAIDRGFEQGSEFRHYDDHDEFGWRDDDHDESRGWGRRFLMRLTWSIGDS
jgi:hypothetical protein